MSRTLLRVALSTGLTVACAAFALTHVSRSDLSHVFDRLEPQLLVPLFGCHLALVVLRAVRVSDQLGKSLSRIILQVTSLHNFLAAVMPMRSGELSFPLILSVRMAVPLARGTIMLLLIRLFDLAVCAGLGLTALAYASPEWIGRFGGWGAGFAGVTLLLVGAFASTKMHQVDRILPHVRKRLTKIGGTAVEAWPSTGFTRSSAGRRLFGITLIIWIVLFLGYVFAARAVGSTADLAPIVVGGAAASLVFALPINGIGSYGPTQIAFATTLASFGHGWDEALIAALLMQTVSLLVLSSAAGVFMLQSRKGNRSALPAVLEGDASGAVRGSTGSKNR